MDIMSQTMIISSFKNISANLKIITQTYQLLEIVDILTGEEQPHDEVYQVLNHIMHQLNQTKQVEKQQMLAAFQRILESLGFTDSTISSELELKAKIEAIAERQLHSKEFLLAKSSPT